MPSRIITALFFTYLINAIDAQNAVIQDPQLISPSYRVYLSPDGNDLNTGDSLFPLATFSAALDKLDFLSQPVTGNIYGEVVVYSGNYSEIFKQPLNKYQIGSKLMNVSLRGKGNVVLDGTTLTVSPGNGMIYLLGSNIHVKNISVNYSSDNGVRFGYNYNGTVINSHDIWIDSVNVTQTTGHGIIVGISPLNTNGSSTLIPRAKRFKISNCHVHNAVNNNTSQTQWGSSVKFLNTSHNQALNNHVHDNSGEGIDFDFCDTAEIRGNLLHDNFANIYLDKMQYAFIHKNLIYNETKVVSGILLGLEAYTAFVTNHYIKDIYIQNNIILNTLGINIWQGIYSALQNGYFQNIQIRNNTIIGKQFGNGSQISFSYNTFLGQPVSNVFFSNLSIDRNIISAHLDSLNNARLISAALDPQPSLTFGDNLFNMNPGFGYNAASDGIVSALLVSVDPISDVLWQLTPNTTYNPNFVKNALNTVSITDDYAGISRGILNTNIGALELNESLFINESKEDFPLIYPNPSSGFLNIHCMDCQLLIKDLNGRLIGLYNKSQLKELNLNPGVYYIINTADNKTEKIIVVQ